MSSTYIDRVFLKNKNNFDHLIGYVCKNNITDHYRTILAFKKISEQISINNNLEIKKKLICVF